MNHFIDTTNLSKILTYIENKSISKEESKIIENYNNIEKKFTDTKSEYQKYDLTEELIIFNDILLNLK